MSMQEKQVGWKGQRTPFDWEKPEVLDYPAPDSGTSLPEQIGTLGKRGGSYNRDLTERELRSELLELYLRYNPEPGIGNYPKLENNRLVKHSKKSPSEAQKIWKELTHEERLKRRQKVTKELISVLNAPIIKLDNVLNNRFYQLVEQEQDGKPVLRPEVSVPLPTEHAAAEPSPARPAVVINPRTEKHNRLQEIKKAVKEHPLRTIAGVVGVGLAVGAIIFAARSCDSSPTPSYERTPTPISGTPRPSEATPTPRPIIEATKTPTVAPKPTPRPTATPEVVKVPDLGVKYDPNTEKCTIVDRNTGKTVDSSNALPIERISYQETGVGVRKDITATLQPGQTAIIQGWKVNGQGDGVFKAIIATETTLKFSVNIADGAVEIVNSQNGPFIFCRAVQIAADKGYAHEKIEIPESWKVTQ